MQENANVLLTGIPLTQPVTEDGETSIMSLKVTTFGLFCYLAAFFPLCLGIVLSNSLVVFAFFEDHRIHRKPANHFLVSLAFADLLTGMVAVPLNVANRLIVSPFTCYSSTRYIFFLPLLLFCGVSMLHLVFIATDRYIAVSRPLKYKKIMNLARVKFFIGCIWLACLITGMWPVVGGLVDRLDVEDVNICGESYYRDGGSHNIAQLYSAFAVLVFFLAIVAFYSRIYSIAWKRINSRPVHEPSNPMSATMTSSEQTGSRATEHMPERQSPTRSFHFTVTMARIIVVSGICWAPSSIKSVVFILGSYDAFSRFVISSACDFILFVSSLVNPLIYGWCSPDFRNAYIKVLKGRKKPNVIFPLP